MAAGILPLLALLLAAATLASPLRTSCPDDGLPRDVCLESIDAALLRGLPSTHPLILSASAIAGPASGSQEHGHRATVTFDLLAFPGTVDVRLYYDMGGHWGAEMERSALELALWWALPVVALAAAAAGFAVSASRAWRARS